MIKVAPSILSANFSCMNQAIEMLNASQADYIHCDVMDGVFVPNITFGSKMISDIKEIANLPLDVHLMISTPERYIENFVKAGADIITIHAEATTHLQRAITQIKHYGMKAGVALNPATPLSAIEYILDDVDLILIMSVNPGFGGQKFIPASIEKIQRLKQMLTGRNIVIEVDGGISAQNAKAVYEAGAELLVAGSAVFSAKDPQKAIEEIKCVY